MDTAKPLLLFNPGAGSAVRAEVETVLGDRLEIHVTRSRGEAERRARRAVEEGVEMVVAGGGDGTLHEVVNGLLPDPGETLCAVLPLGTGNDFARTLRMPMALERWAEVLERRRTRAIDVIEIEGSRGRRWAINSVVGGAIDRVEEKLTKRLKRSWGPLSYLRATAETLPELEPFAVEIDVDDGEHLTLELLSVVVANGRTIAGGVPVAPAADPGDGWMDCILVRAVEGLDLVTLAGKVLLGTHLDDESIVYRRARSLHLRSRPAMAFHADGERLDGDWARYTLHPGRLRMLVGEPAADT